MLTSGTLFWLVKPNIVFRFLLSGRMSVLFFDFLRLWIHCATVKVLIDVFTFLHCNERDKSTSHWSEEYYFLKLLGTTILLESLGNSIFFTSNVLGATVPRTFCPFPPHRY
mmetsp:Transcript_38197/g.80365  ORF Transcript_38197/g.80365 Transcript_38197/m.80365 type:complete len:111 (-) Transcript_38197:95-427(-)